jgi:soluble lytic murein transglycosylase-like protein
MPLPGQIFHPKLLVDILAAIAIAVTTAGANAGEISAEPALVTSPLYKLKFENSTSFRLAPATAPRPTSETAGETTSRAQLADQPFAAQVAKAARESALDPALVHALIYVESRYNPAARSPKGALGLMQILPETASRYGVTGAGISIDANLEAGTRYLRDLIALFDGRLDLVLAAYNAGENTVYRYGLRIPPYRETQRYVPSVLERYRALREPPIAETSVQRRIEYLPGTLLHSPAQARFQP